MHCDVLKVFGGGCNETIDLGSVIGCYCKTETGTLGELSPSVKIEFTSTLVTFEDVTTELFVLQLISCMS